MFGIATSAIVKIGVALVILSVAGGVAYWLYTKGAAEARVEVLQNSIEKIQERSITNERINNLSDAQLCTALDGVWNIELQTCE